MKQYKLIKKYPSLPKDWEVGMLVGHGDRQSSSYYSPCSIQFTDRKICHTEVVNHPEFWQQAIEEEMEEFDKQETLEEAAEKYRKHWVNNTNSTISDTFMAGAKWQSERIPSIIEEYLETAFISKEQGYMNPQKWFEQFKKK